MKERHKAIGNTSNNEAGFHSGYMDFVSRSDEDEDEDDDGDLNEDDRSTFLAELESDPMSHLADYNFSEAELNWIKKLYDYSSRFMLSFGLKPFEQEDCDEAKAIVRAFMEDDK
jgi:hypothetical protein